MVVIPQSISRFMGDHAKANKDGHEGADVELEVTHSNIGTARSKASNTGCPLVSFNAGHLTEMRHNEKMVAPFIKPTIFCNFDFICPVLLVKNWTLKFAKSWKLEVEVVSDVVVRGKNFSMNKCSSNGIANILARTSFCRILLGCLFSSLGVFQTCVS